MRALLIIATTCLIGCGTTTPQTTIVWNDGQQTEQAVVWDLFGNCMVYYRHDNGDVHAFAGESMMGVLVPGAATAYQGREIGQGLEKSGNETNVDVSAEADSPSFNVNTINAPGG